MKKLFVLATAAFLVTGMAFAHEGDGKKCAKAKDCCKDKKECKDMKKEDKKETKEKTATKTKA
jgi:hypothetical protein